MKKVMLALLVSFAFGQSDYMVCKKDVYHEVCRFSNGSAVETICHSDGACSIFHWTKAQAVKRAEQLRVQPSYDEIRSEKVAAYMLKGMTVGEAEQKVHEEELAKTDPGVEKARIELCHKGILKGDRCKN
jgi:hypothetical protein